MRATPTPSTDFRSTARCTVLLLALTLAAAPAFADWDEGVDGDLSTDPANPTALTVAVGSNVLTGTIQSPGDTRDYVTFTVASGTTLTAITQLDYFDVNTMGNGDVGFHAIIEGATSFVPDGANIGSFLGSAHLVTLTPGTDMLPTLGAAPQGGMGFTPPLGPGTYTYHVQQTGTEHTGYEIDLEITADPPPPAPALSPLGLGLLAVAAIGSGALVLRRRND